MVCVKWTGVLEGHTKVGKLGDHPHIQESKERMNTSQRHISLASKEMCIARTLKKYAVK